MGAPAADAGTAVRRTAIGGFNVHQPGKSGPRAIPVPWIDCGATLESAAADD